MTSTHYETALSNTKHKGSERFVLSLIGLCHDKGEEATTARLVELSGLTPKQIHRIGERLKLSGAIAFHEGKGRAQHTYSIASDNRDILSPQRSVDVVVSADKIAPQDNLSSQNSQDKKSSPVRSADILSPLSDASGDNLSGTPVAPYSAETTNTEKKKKPEEGDATASARPPKHFPDPRLKHPAIIAVRRHIKGYPREENRDEVIAALGQTPDLAKLAECYAAWFRRGFNGFSIIPATEWYLHGIPERNGNHAGNQRNSSPNQQPPKPSLADRARQHAEHFGLGTPTRRAG